MSTNGKGDTRRPGKPGAYEQGYDAIDWSKGRPAPSNPKDTELRTLVTGGDGVGWVIPDLSEILGPTRYADLTELKKALDERDKTS